MKKGEKIVNFYPNNDFGVVIYLYLLRLSIEIWPDDFISEQWRFYCSLKRKWSYRTFPLTSTRCRRRRLKSDRLSFNRQKKLFWQLNAPNAFRRWWNLEIVTWALMLVEKKLNFVNFCGVLFGINTPFWGIQVNCCIVVIIILVLRIVVTLIYVTISEAQF